MRAMAGIRNEQDSAAVSTFLQAQRGLTSVTATAVVPSPRGLSAVIDYPRRHRPNSVSRLQELQKANANELLSAFQSSAARPGLSIQTSTIVGNPAGALIQAARQQSADFIVVTQRHGERRNGPDLGHVASRVARYAPCNALLLDHTRPAPRTVLYATDGSPQAQKAGLRIRDMQIQDSPTIPVCTVVQAINTAFVKTGGYGYDEFQRIRDEFHKEEEAAAQRILASAAALFKDTGYKTRTLTYEGDPVAALMRVIQEYNVDLLALGAKGLSAVSEFLLGSITLRMMGRAPCSTLVAR